MERARFLVSGIKLFMGGDEECGARSCSRAQQSTLNLSVYVLLLWSNFFPQACSGRIIPPLRTFNKNLCSSRPFSYSYQLNVNLTEIGICAYYDEVVRVFRAADPVALSKLFDVNISKPMSHRDVFTWATDFFAKYGSATFEIDGLELESFGNQSAVTLLTYRVKTLGAAGDFGGKERDFLLRVEGRWLVSAWEQVESSWQDTGRGAPASLSCCCDEEQQASSSDSPPHRKGRARLVRVLPSARRAMIRRNSAQGPSGCLFSLHLFLYLSSSSPFSPFLICV
jgi:hypothetical protein